MIKLHDLIQSIAIPKKIVHRSIFVVQSPRRVSESMALYCFTSFTFNTSQQWINYSILCRIVHNSPVTHKENQHRTLKKR